MSVLQKRGVLILHGSAYLKVMGGHDQGKGAFKMSTSTTARQTRDDQTKAAAAQTALAALEQAFEYYTPIDPVPSTETPWDYLPFAA